MRLTLICLLVLIVSSFPCFAQQSTPEDFRDFSNAFVGRWVAEVILVADWPGIGKRGEAVTGYTQITPVADGKALLESSRAITSTS